MYFNIQYKPRKVEHGDGSHVPFQNTKKVEQENRPFVPKRECNYEQL